jgi:hypothetical protein
LVHHVRARQDLPVGDKQAGPGDRAIRAQHAHDARGIRGHAPGWIWRHGENLTVFRAW